jgi:glycosyltransferase involved in cell wall biosynthesis
MKISYAITVCNEYVEIQKLVKFLLENKRPKDEIIVLFDQSNGSEEIDEWLVKHNKLPNFQMWRGYFDGHFGEWKNKLTDYCSGDYIFQLDADELPHPNLINVLPQILSMNPKNEVFLVPRVNTVEGITEEHIQKWGWNLNKKGWVNFPDFQTRIWKKEGRIRWYGKVHERLVNFNTYTNLPEDEIYSIYHPKTIDRQEKQNKLYSDLQS